MQHSKRWMALALALCLAGGAARLGMNGREGTAPAESSKSESRAGLGGNPPARHATPRAERLPVSAATSERLEAEKAELEAHYARDYLDADRLPGGGQGMEPGPARDARGVASIQEEQAREEAGEELMIEEENQEGES